MRVKWNRHLDGSTSRRQQDKPEVPEEEKKHGSSSPSIFRIFRRKKHRTRDEGKEKNSDNFSVPPSVVPPPSEADEDDCASISSVATCASQPVTEVCHRDRTLSLFSSFRLSLPGSKKKKRRIAPAPSDTLFDGQSKDGENGCYSTPDLRKPGVDRLDDPVTGLSTSSPSIRNPNGNSVSYRCLGELRAENSESLDKLKWSNSRCAGSDLKLPKSVSFSDCDPQPNSLHSLRSLSDDTPGKSQAPQAVNGKAVVEEKSKSPKSKLPPRSSGELHVTCESKLSPDCSEVTPSHFPVNPPNPSAWKSRAPLNGESERMVRMSQVMVGNVGDKCENDVSEIGDIFNNIASEIYNCVVPAVADADIDAPPDISNPRGSSVDLNGTGTPKGNARLHYGNKSSNDDDACKSNNSERYSVRVKLKTSPQLQHVKMGPISVNAPAVSPMPQWNTFLKENGKNYCTAVRLSTCYSSEESLPENAKPVAEVPIDVRNDSTSVKGQDELVTSEEHAEQGPKQNETISPCDRIESNFLNNADTKISEPLLCSLNDIGDKSLPGGCIDVSNESMNITSTFYNENIESSSEVISKTDLIDTQNQSSCNPCESSDVHGVPPNDELLTSTSKPRSVNDTELPFQIIDGALSSTELNNAISEFGHEFMSYCDKTDTDIYVNNYLSFENDSDSSDYLNLASDYSDCVQRKKKSVLDFNYPFIYSNFQNFRYIFSDSESYLDKLARSRDSSSTLLECPDLKCSKNVATTRFPSSCQSVTVDSCISFPSKQWTDDDDKNATDGFSSGGGEMPLENELAHDTPIDEVGCSSVRGKNRCQERCPEVPSISARLEALPTIVTACDSDLRTEEAIDTPRLFSSSLGAVENKSERDNDGGSEGICAVPSTPEMLSNVGVTVAALNELFCKENADFPYPGEVSDGNSVYICSEIRQDDFCGQRMICDSLIYSDRDMTKDLERENSNCAPSESYLGGHNSYEKAATLEFCSQQSEKSTCDVSRQPSANGYAESKRASVVDTSSDFYEKSENAEKGESENTAKCSEQTNLAKEMRDEISDENRRNILEMNYQKDCVAVITSYPNSTAENELHESKISDKIDVGISNSALVEENEIVTQCNENSGPKSKDFLQSGSKNSANKNKGSMIPCRRKGSVPNSTAKDSKISELKSKNISAGVLRNKVQNASLIGNKCPSQETLPIKNKDSGCSARKLPAKTEGKDKLIPLSKDKLCDKNVVNNVPCNDNKTKHEDSVVESNSVCEDANHLGDVLVNGTSSQSEQPVDVVLSHIPERCKSVEFLPSDLLPSPIEPQPQQEVDVFVECDISALTHESELFLQKETALLQDRVPSCTSFSQVENELLHREATDLSIDSESTVPLAVKSQQCSQESLLSKSGSYASVQIPRGRGESCLHSSCSSLPAVIGGIRSIQTSKECGNISPSSPLKCDASNAGKSRIPKKQAGSRGVHHSTKPVRPPMWLSKAELTQEIQRLGNLCEARTKELNRLKMETKHVSAGFDSFATLFKYMVDDLNALSVPKLTKDLEKTLKQLELTKQDLAYYEREVEEIKAHHCQELNDLSNKLYDVYQSEVAELNNKHQEEINRLKSEHEKQMESLTESYSASDEEIRLKHEKLIANLEQEITKQREELQLYQEKEIKDLEEKHAQGTKVLQEHIDQLQKKYAELKQHSLSMEDALRKDTDSKLQWVTTRKSDLEKEVESLKTVLELKNKELHSLRVQNLEMEKQLEELPFAKEKIKMLQARAEDLEALMVEKTKLERKLSNENHQVKEIYEKEAKVNRRLSMENEELQWRLRQAEQSLISGSFSEVVESPEEADGAASPAKSPAPQILSRSVFFTFVDKDNTSPHSPRSQYKKITPGFSANYKTSPGKASKSPPAPSPRKMRSQSDVLHSMNSGNGSTPRKLAKQPTNKNKAPPKRQRSGSDCGKQPAENNDVSFLSVTESMTSSVSSESSVFEHRERLLEEHKDQIMASLEILREQRSAESSVDESVTQKKWCRDDSFVPNETHKFESEEMSRSAEFADPKTFYHMTFPVLKEAGIADCDIDDSARSSNSANSPMKEGTSDIMHSTSNTSLPNEREENLQVSQISSNVTNVSPEETCDPVVTSNNTKSKVSLQSALSAEDLHKTESNECNIAQDRFRTV